MQRRKLFIVLHAILACIAKKASTYQQAFCRQSLVRRNDARSIEKTRSSTNMAKRVAKA